MDILAENVVVRVLVVFLLWKGKAAVVLVVFLLVLSFHNQLHWPDGVLQLGVTSLEIPMQQRVKASFCLVLLMVAFCLCQQVSVASVC